MTHKLKSIELNGITVEKQNDSNFNIKKGSTQYISFNTSDNLDNCVIKTYIDGLTGGTVLDYTRPQYKFDIWTSVNNSLSSSGLSGNINLSSSQMLNSYLYSTNQYGSYTYNSILIFPTALDTINDNNLQVGDVFYMFLFCGDNNNTCKLDTSNFTVKGYLRNDGNTSTLTLNTSISLVKLQFTVITSANIFVKIL